MSGSSFPDGFLWGASTASYQIEGAAREDGRGPSIWDTFSAVPGKVKNGDTGARACDHYHRYAEDIALMKGLGLKAYRFSLAWPRLLPAGRGAPNEAGLVFYDRLIDALLEADIEPWVCLYHWDLPQALEDAGGWPNRDIAGWFADYAALAARRYGDRVKHWASFNEPNVFTFLGYGIGIHAPGRTDRTDCLKAIHHVNLAHGAALSTLRDGVTDAKLGAVLNLHPVRPESESAADAEAAVHIDAVWNRAFAEPMVNGAYLDPLKSDLEAIPGLVRDGDLAHIQQRIDFFGLNHYSRLYARAAPDSPWGFGIGTPPADVPKTGMGWHIDPGAFRDQIIEIDQRYGRPAIYITENGFGAEETAGPDGMVDDRYRIDYIAAYLHALLEAREAGADVRGYFVWSLLDNYEWSEGYSKRFGIIRVDYETMKRTPKASYNWLKTVIAGNAIQ
jgi:beta-glucosidase